MAAVMEEHLSGRQFVVGERFSVGDIVLAYTLDWADTQELLAGLPELARLLGADVRAAEGGHADRAGLREPAAALAQSLNTRTRSRAGTSARRRR